MSNTTAQGVQMQPMGTGAPVPVQSYQQQQLNPLVQPQGPPLQAMEAQLENIQAIALRQKAQPLESCMQAFGICLEEENEYRVSIAPVGEQRAAEQQEQGGSAEYAQFEDEAQLGGVRVATSPDDPRRWKPTNEELLNAAPLMDWTEESSCCLRCLTNWCRCGNLRPLRLNSASAGGQEFYVDRPFLCGGWICCPLEMTLYRAMLMQNQRVWTPVGRVRENFDPYCDKCFHTVCLCTRFHNVEVYNNALGFQKSYELRANEACCGRVDNCCGATCCKNDQVFDVLTPAGEIASHLQRTYAAGAGAFDALCRCCCLYNQYALSFPQHANGLERTLLILSIIQLDFQTTDHRAANTDYLYRLMRSLN